MYAVGHVESTFGSTAPGRRTDFLLYIGGENFCASGVENSPLGSTAPGCGTDLLFYRGRKFSALGHRISNKCYDAALVLKRYVFFFHNHGNVIVIIYLNLLLSADDPLMIFRFMTECGRSMVELAWKIHYEWAQMIHWWIKCR